MRKIVAAVALLSLCTAAPAQRGGGSANRKSPTMSSSIEFSGGGKLSISYQAVAWAKGRAMSAILDQDNGAEARKRFNERALSNPIGKLAVTADVEVGGVAITAGDYDMSFTVSDDLHWHLLLANRTTDTLPLKIALDLKQVDEHIGRLRINVVAGEADSTGGLLISFGAMHGGVHFGLPAADK